MKKPLTKKELIDLFYQHYDSVEAVRINKANVEAKLKGTRIRPELHVSCESSVEEVFEDFS
jgi:hypothetical protein